MYEFKVSGMTCGSCANSITLALKTIDPKVKVVVDVKSQTVQVESAKNENDIAVLIEETGYPVLVSKKVN